MDIFNGMKFQNAKGYWWEVVDCSVSRSIVVKSLEWMPYTTTIRKESVQKGVVMYPYGKNQYGGYRGEGRWNASQRNPYFQVWNGLLVRCNDTEFKSNNPSYASAAMLEEWYNLQTFCEWCESSKPNHDNIRWELDKDLLGDGNLYSPDTCCFLPKDVNLFLSKMDRAYVPRSSGGKWQVWCSDGINLGNRYVGTYPTLEEAMDIWKQKKNARLLSLIEKYKCVLPRHVTDALYSLMK